MLLVGKKKKKVNFAKIEIYRKAEMRLRFFVLKSTLFKKKSRFDCPVLHLNPLLCRWSDPAGHQTSEAAGHAAATTVGLLLLLLPLLLLLLVLTVLLLLLLLLLLLFLPLLLHLLQLLELSQLLPSVKF